MYLIYIERDSFCDRDDYSGLLCVAWNVCVCSCCFLHSLPYLTYRYPVVSSHFNFVPMIRNSRRSLAPNQKFV